MHVFCLWSALHLRSSGKVDDEVLDNLEEVLITSDVGVETTLNIIKRIETKVR